MSEDLHLLSDIRLELRRNEFRPIYQVMVDQGRGPGGQANLIDLAMIDGRDNLAQAVIMRLLTPRGELSHLGHPQYGSRVRELVGRVNTETTRNLLRLYIIESLQQETRIDKVDNVAVCESVSRPSSVDVTLQVTPTHAIDSITVGPFTLELA